MAARGDEEDLLADYAVSPSRASSSYRLEPDNNGPLSGSRSSSSTSLNGRRESTNSLFSRRPSGNNSTYPHLSLLFPSCCCESSLCSPGFFLSCGS
jgi:hypothetical protein